MAEVKNGLDGKTDSLYANGLHIAKDRYVLTKVEDDNKMLYARKVCSSCNRLSQPCLPSFQNTTIFQQPPPTIYGVSKYFFIESIHGIYTNFQLSIN